MSWKDYINYENLKKIKFDISLKHGIIKIETLVSVVFTTKSLVSVVFTTKSLESKGYEKSYLLFFSNRLYKNTYNINTLDSIVELCF